MEGYSVTEAASVLGVPTERVWELLARGVLSGAPEGETGMRVFLQPRPAPAVDDARPSNGHGRSPDPAAEASPFRELLTEFRNLTERYGQALLALGEARGEVASLRSRVDVLEARMDLRLPMSPQMPASTGPMPWEMSRPRPDGPVAPSGRRSAAPPAPAASDEMVAAEATVSVDRESEKAGRRRRKAQHHATEAFAEALARAQDPNPAELPDIMDAVAQSVVHLGDEAVATEESIDATLPRELPAADAIAVAEVDAAEVDAVATPTVDGTEPDHPPAEPAGAVTEGPDSPETPLEPAVAAEPEWPLEPAVAAEPEWLLEPAVAADGEVEPVAGAEPVAEAEPTPEHEPAAEPEPAVALQPMPEPEPEPAVVGETELPQVSHEPTAEAVLVAPPVSDEPEAEESSQIPSQVTSEPWDPERYTTRIDEPDWWMPEDSLEPETAEPPPAPVVRAEPVASDERPAEHPVRAAPTFPAEHQPAQPHAGEETVLWFGSDVGGSATSDDDAAAEMEVVSTGRQTARPTDPRPLPGSTELDEAMVAFDQLAQQHPPPPTPASPLEPPVRGPEPMIGRIGAVPVVSRAPVDGPTAASRAYRRLRRIFPG